MPLPILIKTDFLVTKGKWCIYEKGYGYFTLIGKRKRCIFTYSTFQHFTSYYSSLTKLVIPSIPAATLSDKVTIAAGKPEIKGVAGGVQL